jgi:hypothetical protein
VVKNSDVVANNVFSFEDMAAGGLSFLLKIGRQPLMRA